MLQAAKNFGMMMQNITLEEIAMNTKNDYIAVFDSGVGGISVLRQLRKLMPGEKFLYFGDSANAPYGVRPVSEVQQLSLNVAAKLVPQGIKALVIACNTATAAAVEVLREAYPDLIVEGIQPAVRLAAEKFPGGTVGVMATPLTMKSPKILALMEKHADQCNLISLPAPGLADLVEAGKGNSPESEALLRPMLEPLAGKLDAIVLGCTHYPFAAETVTDILGKNTVCLDGGEETARNTMNRLRDAGLLADGEPEIVWQNSLDDPRMLELSRQLLEM